MRTAFFTIPVTYRNLPQSVIDALTAKLNLGVGYLTPANTASTKAGSLIVPVGAVAAEIITEDAYFFEGDLDDHTYESIAGINRIKVKNLDGNMKLNVYAYISNSVHVAVHYA